MSLEGSIYIYIYYILTDNTCILKKPNDCVPLASLQVVCDV